MNLVTQAKLEIKRLDNASLLKLQDIIQNEVDRRQSSKKLTEGGISG